MALDPAIQELCCPKIFNDALQHMQVLNGLAHLMPVVFIDCQSGARRHKPTVSQFSLNQVTATNSINKQLRIVTDVLQSSITENLFSHDSMKVTNITVINSSSINKVLQ